jgi:hypothetical protein
MEPMYPSARPRGCCQRPDVYPLAPRVEVVRQPGLVLRSELPFALHLDVTPKFL